jgi:hypothetical protein
MMLHLLVNLLFILTTPHAPAPPPSTHDYSRAAREVIDEMNRVRKDPSDYAEKYIRPRRKFYRGKEYEVSPTLSIVSIEGVEAVDDCLEALAKAKSAGPLKWSEGLALASADHVKDQGRSGKVGHAGEDQSTPSERVERYGEWKKTVGENISYGSDVPREIVIQLLIDDGVPSRGHRENILNPQFHVAGAAIGPHKEFRHMCVMDLAGGFTEHAHGSEKERKRSQ